MPSSRGMKNKGKRKGRRKKKGISQKKSFLFKVVLRPDNIAKCPSQEKYKLILPVGAGFPAPPAAFPNIPAFLTQYIDTSPSPLSGYCPVPATRRLTTTLVTPLIQFLHPPPFPVSPFRSSHSSYEHQRKTTRVAWYSWIIVWTIYVQVSRLNLFFPRDPCRTLLNRF